MKICMSCRKKVPYLQLDDDGLYVCDDCERTKRESRLRRAYYSW